MPAAAMRTRRQADPHAHAAHDHAAHDHGHHHGDTITMVTTITTTSIAITIITTVIPMLMTTSEPLPARRTAAG